jgi:hypothetical protein
MLWKSVHTSIPDVLLLEFRCFGYTPCPMEIAAEESLPSDDASPSPVPLPTGDDTPSPATSVNNIGITQNYCAKSLDDLSANCATAVTCNDGEPDCPDGTWCWGDRPCGEVVDSVGEVVDSVDKNATSTLTPSLVTLAPSLISLETRSPSETPVLSTLSPIVQLESSSPISASKEELYCATTMEDLETSCSTAQECNSGPCPTGTFCFPFTCNDSAPELTDNEPSQQLYCATTMTDLETSCSTAQECNSGPCPTGLFCFPFNCDGSSLNNQSMVPASSSSPTQEPLALEISTNNAEETLCPPTYTGWLSLDCIEYWECTDGLAGPIRTCPERSRFDKVIKQCNSEELVNNFCYGPPPNAANGDQAQTDVTGQGNNSSAEPNSNDGEGVMCKGGRSGWEAAPGCR